MALCFRQPGNDIVEALAALQIREHKRPVAAHAPGVAVHDLERRTDVRRESILLITSSPLRLMPGPPLRGILSPPATSIT